MGRQEMSVDILRGETICYAPILALDPRHLALDSTMIDLPDDELLMPDVPPRHEAWMQKALLQAQEAFSEQEVPVGAVIVHQGRVIAAAHNQRETLKDPTAHAEMIAITQASQTMASWRLTDCILYVTLEPCPMCAGAIVQARIPQVVYGTTDPKAGACHSLYSITSDNRLNHRSEVIAGVMQHECAEILQRFFVQQRALGKK